MIDLLNILTHFEQDGRGLLFFKDGTRSGVAAAIRLTKGINHLYLSEKEMEVQYKNLVDILSSLPTFDGQRGMLYQFYAVPSFEFGDITNEMENLCTNDDDFRMIYDLLVKEKISQVRKFAGDKKILRYNLFLIARYFTKGGFVPDLLHALKNEGQIIKDEMLTIRNVIDEFVTLQSLFHPYSPKPLSTLSLINLMRAHYGLPQLKSFCSNRPLATTIFSREIDFNSDCTVVKESDKDVYLRTYSAATITGNSRFFGAMQWDMPGDFRMTHSFSIPDNSRFIKWLRWKKHIKTFLLSFKLFERYSDTIRQNKAFSYINSVIDHIYETGEKRVRVAAHLTLLSNQKTDTRMSRNITSYFSNASLEPIYEKDRQEMVNLASATPFSYSNISLNSLKREMTVPLSQYADMVPMFQEEEGSREPFRIFYTRMGIYKVNPYDPSFPAGHVLKIGGTGFGKTFDTLGEIVNEHLHGTNIIYVSCKGEAERLTNVLGGIHDDLSVDGSTKLLPFTIPESVRKDRNNFVSAISQMVDFLQFMTGNKEKEVEFTYQEILKTLFTRKEYVSVTRIADILTERSLSKESQSLRRFSEQGLYGDLFDGEGEYGLNIYDNRLISINTQHIKQLSDDAFILANKILFKKTIDIASRKAGKTAIYFDETKELFKHPEIALSLGTMVSQARSANTRITIIDQDAAYLSENKKFSKMILANTPLTVILGINSEDSYTPKTLGLSQNEESICRTLKIQPGRFSESYYITPNERIKLFNYSTPLFYALATTTPDDVTVMNYIFESFYSKRDDPRYTHMKTAIHFSDLFPGGVGQYPEWNEILIKNRKNIINTYLEIKNKHEVSV